MKQITTRYSIRSLCFGFLALLLFGCHQDVEVVAEEQPPPLPYRVAGTNDKHVKEIAERLHRQGVRIITMGQDYLLSIPSDRIFSDQSPHIMWRSYALLNDVVCYLKEFRKISVDVSAFSSKYVSPARERALTSARARAVADYLWSQRIDSRFVFTRGLASDKPIFVNEDGADNSPNSRIEITFRDAVA